MTSQNQPDGLEKNPDAKNVVLNCTIGTVTINRTATYTTQPSGNSIKAFNKNDGKYHFDVISAITPRKDIKIHGTLGDPTQTVKFSLNNPFTLPDSFKTF